MSKKISLGVAATIAIIAMAVTFSLTMVVSMKMFNTTVSSVKNKERQYNKLSEIDRFVRAGEYFTIDEDTLNDRLAAGYMNGINDKYAVYYTAKECSEKQSVEKGTLTGIGVLTEQLCKRADNVVSIEVDKRLPPLLEETMADYDNFKLILNDVLKVDLKALLAEEFGGKPVAVCANLPYYITSPILMRLLEEKLPIRNITVMVQKEAAQRLCAAPGTRDAGAISYAVAYYAEPKLLFSVQPGSFYPAPKVTSAVIRLDVREKPAVTVPNGDEAAFFALIRAAFSQRRKIAANAIANGLHLPKAQVISALQAAGLDERSRPEQLTLENYCALQTVLANT